MTSTQTVETDRTWRVTTTILVPTHVDAGPDGGMPTVLNFQSRLPEQKARYGDTVVAVRQHQHPEAGVPMDPRLSLMELVADVTTGGDPASAVEALELLIVTLVDLVSFQIGATIGIGQVDVIDITPPLAVGDERDYQVFAGSPFGRHQRGVDMEAVRGQMYGTLPTRDDIGGSRNRAALHWFVKSLGTDVLHDAFLFLWISLEICVKQVGVTVEGPYKGPCDHVIATCPICGTPTAKQLQGPTLRNFIEQFGISETDSKALWKYRQMVHGAISFDPGSGADLGRLVQLLRAVVAAALKNQLGLGVNDAPLVATTGLSIHPAMSLSGTTHITEQHLESLG